MVIDPAKVAAAAAPVGQSTTPIAAQASVSHTSDSDDSSDEDDDTWDDFDDQDGTGLSYTEGGGSGVTTGLRQPTLALFPEAGSKELKTFASAAEALDAASAQGCDMVAVVQRLGLDALAVIRLLNHLRREPGDLAPVQISGLTGSEPFLLDDKELQPVPGSENDGLLQIDFDDLIEARANAGQEAIGDIHLRNRVAELESQLQAIQMSYADLQTRSLKLLGLKADGTPTKDAAGLAATPAKRDDDTNYFDSYAGNDIHQTMLSDTVRTLSYAKFILAPENAHIFRGARVMDIGAGSGILSMLAARAGAAQVIAVDASNIAVRAEKNIHENGLSHIISVVRGKIEDLDEELAPYKGKVDVIISEWMGYFLLYECMLPSVLHARDVYLRKEPNPQRPLSGSTGLLAPSHNRMTLAAVSDEELLHERINFWNDVYGFKMSAMTEGLFDEAYVETLAPESIVSNVVDIFDLPLGILPARQPVFRSPFKLRLQKDATVHGFTSWFDTWFMGSHQPYLSDDKGKPIQPKGGQALDLPPCTIKPVEPSDVPGIELLGNRIIQAPMQEQLEKDAQAGGLPVSFTTGPFGKPTHWKQSVFLLKEPIVAKQGDAIAGDIIVTQSETNSRELDVELHYLVESASAPAQEGKHVQTRIVNLFKVR